MHSAGLFDLRPGLVHILYLNPEVVDAGVAKLTLRCGRVVVLELQNGQIDVTIAEVNPL